MVPVTPPASQPRSTTPKSEKIDKTRQREMKRPAATPKAKNRMKRPAAAIEPEKEPEDQHEDMEEEELEQEDMVELPLKRPSSKDGVKKNKGGEQIVEKPKAKKHELNFIERITYPDGWEYAEIQTAKGRRYKRYISPRGFQHFVRFNAVGAGYHKDRT